MEKVKLLVANHPLAFAFVVTLVFILMVIISSVAANAFWPADTTGWFTVSTIGRLVSILILLLALWRLGWQDSAGFTRAGQWGTWLFLLLPLAYSIAISAFAMTGNLDFRFADPALAGAAALFLIAHAFLEEVAFRGFILHGFVRRWDRGSFGLAQSVLVSSLFFGGMHVVYLAGEALPVVLLRIVFAFLLGIFLGMLVLNGRSIYPAAFFHGVLNLAGYLNLTRNGVDGTPSAWLLMSLLMIPLAVFGIYLVMVVPLRPAVPEIAK